MKKKQKHLSGWELNNKNRQDKLQFDIAGKAHMLLTLAVLTDEFNWGPDELNRYVNAYQEVLSYYNDSDDYHKLLQDWNNYFYETAGIKVL